MVAAYNQQDLSILEEVINGPNWMTPEVHDLMLTKKNKKWLEIIPNSIFQNKTLITVGATHPICEVGLINLLRQNGYTVTSVKD